MSPALGRIKEEVARAGNSKPRPAWALTSQSDWLASHFRRRLSRGIANERSTMAAGRFASCWRDPPNPVPAASCYQMTVVTTSASRQLARRPNSREADGAPHHTLKRLGGPP
jgi:hypothetical protein